MSSPRRAGFESVRWRIGDLKRGFGTNSPTHQYSKSETALGIPGQFGGVPMEHDPVDALLLVHVEALAIVAANSLGLDDFRSLDRAPLTRPLADLARLALGPALDRTKRRHGRNDAECRADRAQKPAVQIANEHRRRQQQADANPHHRRAGKPEHPERFDD